MKSIRLRQLVEEDICNLPELLLRGFPKTSIEIWEKRFYAWWQGNPSWQESLPRGWILEKDKSEIVGFIGNIPVEFFICNRVELAFANSSWYVNPVIRGTFGIQLLLKYVTQSNARLLISTTPNAEAAKILTRFNFESLKLPFNNTEYTYILKLKSFLTYSYYLLKNRKKKESHPNIEVINDRLKWDIFEHAREPLSTTVRDSEYSCEVCKYCDNSFSELWENNRKTNEISICRNSKILNWAFFSEIVKHKRLVIKCIAIADKSIVGYCAFDIKYFFPSGQRYLELKDLYIPNIKPEIIDAVLAYVFAYGSKIDAAFVRFWSLNEEMDLMIKKFFLIKRKKEFSYYFKMNVVEKSKLSNCVSNYFAASPIDPDRGII